MLIPCFCRLGLPLLLFAVCVGCSASSLLSLVRLPRGRLAARARDSKSPASFELGASRLFEQASKRKEAKDRNNNSESHHLSIYSTILFKTAPLSRSIPTMAPRGYRPANLIDTFQKVADQMRQRRPELTHNQKVRAWF